MILDLGSGSTRAAMAGRPVRAHRLLGWRGGN
jgi:hypothetical protein